MDELNIIREVGSIAAGHGSIALSEILGRKIVLEVPSCGMITKVERGKTIMLDSIGVVIFSRILVGLKGEVVFLLNEENAFKLISITSNYKDTITRGVVPTEMGMSVLKEVGSIVIGAYLNALSLMLKRLIIPPLPTLINGQLDDILDLILGPYADDEYSYLVETAFECKEENIKGSFYLILTPDASQDIKDHMEGLLKDLEEPDKK